MFKKSETTDTLAIGPLTVSISRRHFIKASSAAIAVPSAVAVAGQVGQPEPILFQIGRLEGVTVITRHWAPGDTRRCRLCHECTADRNVCTVMTTARVSEADAPLYDSRGLDRD